jgi:hypothetical protein
LEFSPNGHGLIIWLEETDASTTLNSIKVDVIDYEQIPVWGIRERIDNITGGDATNVALSMNRCGKAMVTWFQDNQSWYRIFHQNTGWEAANLINNDPSCQSLSINADLSGACVYTQSVDDKSQVFGKVFTLESGWSNA